MRKPGSRRRFEQLGSLIEIIKRSIPAKIRATGGHPAKRTFQAIRIEVNQELTVLSESLDGMIDLLNDGGRLCVITFHSLEDRIRKKHFQKKRASMYVSAGISGLCMRKEVQGNRSNSETDLAGRRGNGNKSPVPRAQNCASLNEKCDGSARRRQRSYGQTGRWKGKFDR